MNAVTVQEIQLVLSSLLTLAGVGSAYWAIFSGPSKRNANRIDKLDEHLTDLDLRIGIIEQAQKTMPTKDDLHQVNLAVERLQGEIATLRSYLEGAGMFRARPAPRSISKTPSQQG